MLLPGSEQRVNRIALCQAIVLAIGEYYDILLAATRHDEAAKIFRRHNLLTCLESASSGRYVSLSNTIPQSLMQELSHSMPDAPPSLDAAENGSEDDPDLLQFDDRMRSCYMYLVSGLLSNKRISIYLPIGAAVLVNGYPVVEALNYMARFIPTTLRWYPSACAVELIFQADKDAPSCFTTIGCNRIEWPQCCLAAWPRTGHVERMWAIDATESPNGKH